MGILKDVKLNFADRLMINELKLPSFAAPKQFRIDIDAQQEALREALNRTKIINISELADFYYRTNKNHVWENGEFGCLIPPFQDFWLEFQKPEWAIKEHQEATKKGLDITAETDQSIGLPYSVGIGFRATRMSDSIKAMEDQWSGVDADKTKQLVDNATMILTSLSNRGVFIRVRNKVNVHGSLEKAMHFFDYEEKQVIELTKFIKCCEQPEYRQEVIEKTISFLKSKNIHYTMTAYCYIEIKKDEVYGPICHWALSLNDKGRLTSDPIYGFPFPDNKSDPKDLLVFHQLLFPCLLAISCLNTKRFADDGMFRLELLKQPNQFASGYRRKRGFLPFAFYNFQGKALESYIRQQYCDDGLILDTSQMFNRYNNSEEQYNFRDDFKSLKGQDWFSDNQVKSNLVFQGMPKTQDILTLAYGESYISQPNINHTININKKTAEGIIHE